MSHNTVDLMAAEETLHDLSEWGDKKKRLEKALKLTECTAKKKKQ